MKTVKRTKALWIVNIAVSVVLVLLIGYLIYYIGSVSVASFASGAIKVHEVKEYYENEDIVVDISRPKLLGFSNKTFQKLLNEKIEYRIATDRNALELYSIEREHHDKFHFSVDYWVKASEVIFSLKVTTDFYYGYVTNLPVSIYYNVDIAKNKLLMLDDLFTDDSYKAKLNAYLATAIEKKLSDMFINNFDGVSEDTKFFIMDGNLYIAFSKYEITSGAAGEPEFRIPTKEIVDILKEEYTGIFK